MNYINIYTFKNKKSMLDIKPSLIKRDWMDQTNNNAYSCIPLNIANQYGWVCHSPTDFSVAWDGGNSIESIQINIDNPKYKKLAHSHFGHGILTISTDFIINTPTNISTYIRGITNYNKEYIYPLDGIVETDWLPFTFTMNYKFHTPGTVNFKKDEPLFMFFPIERKFIDSFIIEEKPLSSNKELHKNYQKYYHARNDNLKSTNNKKQRFYVSGKVIDTRQDIANHQVKLDLNDPNLKTN